jgi:CMP-N,N'-diacetyllegionaminic acid synthase
VLNGKRVLAVVPARGGSKGVPLKNLRPLLGKPLVTHVGDIVRATALIDRAVVSTDHEEIAAVAEAAGLAAPFRRPQALSGDRIGDWDVLHHALLEMERLDRARYDVVVMLQPTSPLRRPAHVADTIRTLVEGGFDAVWTVNPTDLKYHPLKQLAIGADGSLDFFDPRGAQIVARQQLTPVYTRNGASYAFSRACLLEEKTTMARRSGAVVIEEPMLSIDTLEDFAKVEAVLRARGDG